ncbi:MAG: efflux transporter outer membrane subunit [Gallionellaceae bacterium]
MPIAIGGRLKHRNTIPLKNCLQSLVFIPLLASLLIGCAAKRDHYDVPAIALPDQYSTATTPDGSTKGVNATPTQSLAPILSSPFSTALAEWWRLLNSAELNALMDRALANNPDLRIATLRIAQSKARLDQSGSGKLPVLSMPMQMNTTYPEFGVSRGNPSGNNSARPTNQISLKGDWRPDIWGESASMYESADLQLLRATFQRDDMQRKVAANIALAYIEYLSLNDRIRVARDTEKYLQGKLTSVRERLKTGDATITQMEQQKAAVYSVRSTFPVLTQQREIIVNRIASLVGAMPMKLKLSPSGFDSIKFPEILPGVPSALLLRRPDVRAAESRLLSADADIDVARAQILPPLDLSAQIGYGSMYMSQLFMPQALFWNTIANLSVTIFDSGKRAKEIEFAQAVHEELLETYVRVIYDAVREVDDALSSIKFTGQRLESQSISSDASLRAWNYSQETFVAGAIDYLELLDTQHTYQKSLDALDNVKMERFSALVNLFSALGGGVASSDPLPGEGARPAALKSDMDYGSILNAATTKHTNISADKKPQAETANEKITTRPLPSLLFSNIVKTNIAAESIDWAGGSILTKGNHWLVGIKGVYDHGAVLPAWRYLISRFTRELNQQLLLPQRQGLVTMANKERASWYRLYIGNFSSRQAAANLCKKLRAGQQNCNILSADAIEGKGQFSALPTQKHQAKAFSAALPSLPIAKVAPPVPPRIVPKPIIHKASGLNLINDASWLVEMADTHERRAIAGAWRGLVTSFPKQMKSKSILPRHQSGAQSAGSPPLYQLYIAPFAKKQGADEFCAMLREGRQRCLVVSSQSLSWGKNLFFSSHQKSATASTNGTPSDTAKTRRLKEEAKLKKQNNALLKEQKKQAQKIEERREFARLKAEKEALLKEQQEEKSALAKKIKEKARREFAQLKAEKEALLKEQEKATLAQSNKEKENSELAQLKAEKEALLKEQAPVTEKNKYDAAHVATVTDTAKTTSSPEKQRDSTSSKLSKTETQVAAKATAEMEQLLEERNALLEEHKKATQTEQNKALTLTRGTM